MAATQEPRPWWRELSGSWPSAVPVDPWYFVWMRQQVSDQLQAEIATALQPLEAIRVAYLFGSHVGGNARPDSDLDIAVHLAPQMDGASRAALILDVIAALTDALGPLGERTDVLDLGRASSTIAFEVIRKGNCLLSRSQAERVGLEAAIARRYDDERPYRELFRRAARQAAERMGKGSNG